MSGFASSLKSNHQNYIVRVTLIRTDLASTPLSQRFKFVLTLMASTILFIAPKQSSALTTEHITIS